MSILRQVSEGVPVRIVAMNHGLKYGVVRTTAFSEWLRSFPDHFKKHGSRKTFTNLRKFPLPEKVEAAA
jgi:hypothetical protein